MPHYTVGSARPVMIGLVVFIVSSRANAATISDDFSTAHDYSLGSVAGTVWSGMHNIPLIMGTGQFEADDGTLHIDNNGVNLGWEFDRSTAPMLFHRIPAGQDFTATVKIVAQTSGNWSTAGIVARAASGTQPGTGADHADENFVTMTSFRMNAGNASEGTTLMKRIQNGAQLSDVVSSINGSTPANMAPLPILLRLERVGGGATYRGFVSDDGGATWQFQSRLRPDVGNPLRIQQGVPAIPMEVGLSYMSFTTLVGESEFDDFVMETYAPKPAPGTPNIGNANSLNITATRGDVIVVDGFRDLSGLNTEPMSWQLIADPLNPATPSNVTTIRVTPSVLPGAQGGETATVDTLGAPLPVDLAQDGSTLFRWNTDVAPRPMMTAQPWSLGTYKWTLRATNDWLQVSNDLTLTITLIDELPGLPGDYNESGTVDAADFTVWRDKLGSATSLPNDDTPGVAQDDYDRWKAHFGESNGSGSGATAGLPSSSVPEPATLALFLFAGIAMQAMRRTRIRQRASRLLGLPGIYRCIGSARQSGFFVSEPAHKVSIQAAIFCPISSIKRTDTLEHATSCWGQASMLPCVVRFNGWVGLVVVAVGLLAVAPTAHAADISWRRPEGGTFSSAGSWFGGVVPGAGDIAHFGLSTPGPLGTVPPYTVSFSALASNIRLIVEDDSVVFDLNGLVYETTNPAIGMALGTVSGMTGQLTVTDGIVTLPFQSDLEIASIAGGGGSLVVGAGGKVLGTMDLLVGLNGAGGLLINNNGDLIANDATIGVNAGSSGVATITGGGSSLLAAALSVGEEGTGTLNITAAGRVDSNSGALGNFVGSTGTANIGGTNSKWTVSGLLTVGRDGSGTLTVTGGGQVTSAQGEIAFLSPSGSHGAVTVDGSNSKWTNTGGLFLGGDGTNAAVGELTISAGGVVQNTRGELDTGSVTVEGLGSQWVNSDSLTIGYKGIGTLTVNGGAVSSGSVLTIGDGSQLASGTMTVTGGGRVSSTDGVIARAGNSTGTVSVAGAGSTWDIDGPLGIGGDADAQVNGGIGTLTIQSGGTVSVAQHTIVFADDELRLVGGTFSSPDISIRSGGTFVWTSGTLHAGIFRESLVVPSGGILAPGNSVGSTEVFIDYSQIAGGILQIEIGGLAPTQFDQVIVTGDAFLGGDLQLALLDNFLPSPASTLTIFDARSISGTFANVANGQRLTTSDGLGSFRVHYGAGSIFDPTQIVLSNFLAALPGDYNQNGIVDAADYTLWRNNLGSGASLPNDDTPGVGQDDYNRWKTHFGQVAGGGAGQFASLPEPSILFSLQIALLFGISHSCRRRT